MTYGGKGWFGSQFLLESITAGKSGLLGTRRSWSYHIHRQEGTKDNELMHTGPILHSYSVQDPCPGKRCYPQWVSFPLIKMILPVTCKFSFTTQTPGGDSRLCNVDKANHIPLTGLPNRSHIQTLTDMHVHTKRTFQRQEINFRNYQKITFEPSTGARELL